MKDWQWFALGLVPFAGAPIQVLRYIVEDNYKPSAGQLAAGAVGSQMVAAGIQRMGWMKVNEALMLYRLHSLGFVDEGYAGTRMGYSMLTGKAVRARTVGYAGSGVMWRSTLPMKLAAPLAAAGFVGAVANAIRTDEPDRYKLLTSYV